MSSLSTSSAIIPPILPSISLTTNSNVLSSGNSLSSFPLSASTPATSLSTTSSNIPSTTITNNSNVIISSTGIPTPSGIASSTIPSNLPSSSSVSSTLLTENSFLYNTITFFNLEIYASIKLGIPIPKKLLEKRAKFEDIITREYRIGMATRATAEVTHYGISHPARTIALAKKQSALVYPTGLIVVRGRRGVTETMIKESCSLAAQIVLRATNLVTTISEPVLEGIVISAFIPLIKQNMDNDILYFERLSSKYSDYIIYEPELLHALIIRVPISKHIPTGMGSNTSITPLTTTNTSSTLLSPNPSSSSSSSLTNNSNNTLTNKNAIITILPDGRICIHNILNRLAGIIAYEWLISRIFYDNYEKSNRILNYGWVEIQKSFEESSSSISLENLGITVPILSNEHNNNSDNHRTIVYRLVNNHNININNSNNMKTDTENASQDSDDNDSNIEENSNDDHDEPVSKRSKVT